MSYTLGEAAKATGVSKTTIQRRIQTGRISAKRDEVTGSYSIDPAELHREFLPVSQQSQNRDLKQDGIAAELAVLRSQLEQERQERQRERTQSEREIARLEKQLEHSEHERRDKDRQLTALLTDQRARASDVIAMPPPNSAAIITPPPAADPAPAATSPPAPATPTRPNAAPVAMKVRPVKKAPAKETGWFRRMMGGR